MQDIGSPTYEEKFSQLPNLCDTLNKRMKQYKHIYHQTKQILIATVVTAYMM
jgi:hypothetical protein